MLSLAVALILLVTAMPAIADGRQATPLPFPTFSATNPMYGGSDFSDLYVFHPSPNRQQASLEVWYFKPGKTKLLLASYSLFQTVSTAGVLQYIAYKGRQKACARIDVSFEDEEAVTIRNGAHWTLRLGRLNNDIQRNALKELQMNANLGAKGSRHTQPSPHFPTCGN